MAAGLGLGLPRILAGSEGQPKAAGASDTVHLAVVGMGATQAVGGVGGRGHQLIPRLREVPGATIVALCDVDQQRAGDVFKKHPKAKPFTDFRRMLDEMDKQIDAVVVATPDHTHAVAAVAAMKRGKHVYCEKPLTRTVHEARVMRQTALQHRVVTQMGNQGSATDGLRRAVELVWSGTIGEVREAHLWFDGGNGPRKRPTDLPPVPESLSWDLWLGPLAWRPYGGEPGHALSGCFIGDVNWSPHHYDIIQWTINPDPKAPIEVSYEAKGPHVDDAIVHYRYANGVQVHSIPYPGEPVGNDGGACFVGSEGRIAVDRDSIVSYPSSILTQPLRPADSRVCRVDSHSGNFLECVRSRRLTLCNPETATYTINAILIGGISMILQRALKWDPAKAEFVGDEEANRLLSYTPRPPWRV